MSYSAFIEKWTHPEYAPKPVHESDLVQVERSLGGNLPPGFKGELVAHGAASATIDLLDAIVDADLDVADIQDFLTPGEMIATTNDWRELGLPRDCIAVATDCSGNLFCFRSGGEAVWLWDHDSNAIEQAAPDFDSWIKIYCAIAGGVTLDD